MGTVALPFCMLGRRCPGCRRAVDAGVAVCPFCGASVDRAVRAPVAGSWGISSEGALPPPTYDTAGGLSGLIEPTPLSVPSDRRALGSILVGGAMALVAGVLALISVVVLPFVTVLDPGSEYGGWLTPELLALVGLAVAGATAFSVVQALAFRSAFQRLAYFDLRFSRPSTLALLAVIGILLAAFGWVVIVGSVYETVVCAGSDAVVPASCIDAGPLLGGIALAGVGALLALVGYVGISVGLWRAGRRYRSLLLRVSAVLLAIPLVGVAGALLALTGAARSRARLS